MCYQTENTVEDMTLGSQERRQINPYTKNVNITTKTVNFTGVVTRLYDSSQDSGSYGPTRNRSFMYTVSRNKYALDIGTTNTQVTSTYFTELCLCAF